jgi:hypothetical protein
VIVTLLAGPSTTMSAVEVGLDFVTDPSAAFLIAFGPMLT